MKLSEIKEKKQQFDESKIGSIIKLSIWIILVIILASFTRGNIKESTPLPIADPEPITKPTSEKIKQKIKNINNYEAEIIVENDAIEKINLTNYLDKYLITYNNEKYYKTDDLYLISTKEKIENKLLNDVTYFNIKNINNYIENIDEDYLTIYKDNSFKISYTIPVDEEKMTFEINENENNAINVIISGKENIDKVEISFNNYYIKNISTNLSNINNIEDIEVD